MSSHLHAHALFAVFGGIKLGVENIIHFVRKHYLDLFLSFNSAIRAPIPREPLYYNYIAPLHHYVRPGPYIF
jgi:hypothetical protein